MVDDATEREAPTRRDALRYGGAVVGGGLLAGCTGQSAPGPPPAETDTDADSTATATATPESTNTDSTTAAETEASTDDDSYAVEMFPVGAIEFESAPEAVTTCNMGWADMAVSLGQADGLRTNRLSAPTLFYDRFGIDYDADFPPLWQDGGWSKEVFYELDLDAPLDVPEEEQLFDRQRVSDIINGDV